MPRYYFHLRDGEQANKDLEGIDLPSISAAREEAEQAAREILAHKVREGKDISRQQFEIHGAWGNLMLQVQFKSVLKLR